MVEDSKEIFMKDFRKCIIKDYVFQEVTYSIDMLRIPKLTKNSWKEIINFVAYICGSIMETRYILELCILLEFSI